MHTLPLLRPGGAACSQDTRVLCDFAGAPLAEVSQAPPLLARLALRELAGTPATAARALWPVLKAAGARLAGESVGGETPEIYAEHVVRATGAPRRWVAAALQELAAALTDLDAALARQVPGGSPVAIVDTGRAPGFAWVPRGRTLALVAPSNHAATHFTWALALALGWRVAVRPGARDPFTPWRLACALRESGLPPGLLAVLPGDHALVPVLVAGADCAVVYGGEAVAAEYAGRQNVLLNGSGRSRVYVDLDGAPPVDALADFVAECILHDGGRKCTAASGLVVRGADAGRLLEALAHRLAAVPLLDPLDPRAQVPAWPEPAAALALAQTLEAAEAAGDVDLVAGVRPGPRLRRVAGATLLAPALLRCRRGSPLFAREWPGPLCTAVVLDAADDPLPWLRGALSLTLVGAPDELPAACLREASIGKVFVGLVPTWHSEPGAPHNGRLSDFLFTAKAFQEEET